MKPTVLVVDDEKTFRVVVEETLTGEGFEVMTARTGEAALSAWQREPQDIIILDRRLPDMDGVQVLEQIVRESQERGVDTLIILATAYADVESAVHALKLGAFDYLSKPLSLPNLVVTMRQALETRRLRSHVRQLEGKATVEFVPSVSSAMRRVTEWAERVAQAPGTTVLIEGESGTGKELIAGLIHRRTPARAEQPFVEINCASLPESLLESELFGHEKGAFTDAKGQKRGLFEQADGGTLFLDEVGELSPGIQAKLLRVLENMTFRRLGGTRDLRVDVRVIAATNRDLSVEVQRGGFRLDLYHRLAVFHLRLPPLRDRPEDILPLANHFLSLLSVRMGRAKAHFAPAVEQLLRSYHYPGNVRELRNLVERAVILSTGLVIGPECFVLPRSGPASGGTPPFYSVNLGADDTPPDLEDLERGYIARVLEFAEGNRAHAARLLGISYPTLVKKLTRPGT